MSTPTFEQVKNKYDAYGIINDNGYITGATISYSKADTMFDEFSDKEEIIGLKNMILQRLHKRFIILPVSISKHRMEWKKMKQKRCI